MKIELPYNADVTVRPRNNETTIEIEDSYYKLHKAIINTILQEDGIDVFIKEFDEDAVYDIIEANEEILHDYLIKSGYVFNKV